MNAFTFPIGKLRGILLFAAKKDIRYYLSGVYFTRAPNGKGIIAVATDGHRLTVIYQEQDISQLAPDFGVILPREELERACKFPVKDKHIGMLDAALIVDGLKATVKTAITVECAPIDGKYPDYSRVIPPMKNREPSRISINADYVADYAKLQRALRPGKSYVELTISTNGPNSSIVVEIGESDAVCILMPMPCESDLTDREWLSSDKGAA